MVSILIRTYNEGKHILKCLEILKSQTYREFEIIFVDSGSLDNTLTKIEEAKSLYQKIKLIKIKLGDFTFGRALNIGIENSNSDSEYIVILSAHAYPKNEFWLENLLKSIQSSPSIAGVFGKQEAFVEHLSNWFVLYQNDGAYQSFYSDYSYYSDSCYHFSNANSIIRKSIWKSLKFDENLPYTEDWLWAKNCLDSGYKIGYSAEAPVFHSHPDSIRGYLRRKRNEIRGTNSIIPDAFPKISNKQLISFFIKQAPRELIKNFTKHGATNSIKFALVKSFDFLIRYKYS